jgi:hypothetical protein
MSLNKYKRFQLFKNPPLKSPFFKGGNEEVDFKIRLKPCPTNKNSLLVPRLSKGDLEGFWFVLVLSARKSL